MLCNNFLKNKLQEGKPVIGTWSVIPSSICAETLSLSELDFLIIDREHGMSSFETAVNMILACERHKVSPLIRVADLTLSEVQRSLDAGAHGLHIPNVCNIEQIKHLLEFAKYPPVGNRGYSPFTRAAQYNGMKADRQICSANGSILIAVHLEGKQALENIDLFIQCAEIDIIFIGLYDLSKSLGKPGNVDDPEVKQYLKHSVQKIREAGKVAGTIATRLDQMEEFIGYGVNYLTYSVDCHVLQQAYSSVANAFKSFYTTYSR